MTPERFRLWKMQLAHADNEWRDAGLLPTLKDGASSENSMMKFMDAYRGDFPDAIPDGLDPEDQMAGNVAFSIVNTMVSTISGETPDPILKPMGDQTADPDARRAAWLNEQVVRTMAIERNFKEEVDMAVLGGILGPFSLIRHGYTPELEYSNDEGNIIPRFKNQTPDLPWIQYLRPWQYRIDPMVNDFRPNGEPRWVAFLNRYYEHQIRDHPDLIFRKDLKPTFFTDIRPKEERTGAMRGNNDPNFMPMYEEWVVYDFERQKFFGISPGSEQLIREEKDWPFNWGRLPYSYLGFNPQLDSPFPVPYMKLFYEEQMMYNRVWTIIKALVVRTQRLMVYNKDQVKDEEANLTNPKFFKEFLGIEGDINNAVKEFASGQIDGQLVGLLYQLKEQIREVLGVSSFDRGQRANVETAAEANQIGAGSMNARGRNQSKLEFFWEDIYRVSHRTFVQSGESRKMVVPIIGQENLEFLSEYDRRKGFLEIDPGELQGDFQYSVRLGSTIKRDPAQDLAVKSSVFNMLGGVESKMLVQQHWHEKLVDLANEDPRQAIISENMVKQMAEQGQAEEEEAPDGQVRSSATQGLPTVTSIGG